MQLMVTKITNDWIWTADLECGKLFTALPKIIYNFIVVYLIIT